MISFLLFRNPQALGPSPMVLLQRHEDHCHPTCDLIELVSVTMLVTFLVIALCNNSKTITAMSFKLGLIIVDNE